MPTKVACVSTSPSILGENPLWDEVSGRLFSIDCMSRKLFCHDVDGARQDEWILPRTPGSFALRAGSGGGGSGMLMAYRRGLAFIEPGTGMLDEIPTPGIDFAKEVFNDGKCDRQGRFWTGTMDREVTEPVGALYRVDPDLRVTRMDDGITLSNGIAWSPDDRTMYYCDSRPGRIWAYDYDIAIGSIENRRVFADFADRKGRPDGCTTDAEGGLWVAEVGAGQVVRFDPSGREVSAVALPVSRPTSVMFGGPGLRTLFVTSMRYGLSAEAARDEPQAGCIFAAELDVAGLPTARFGG